MDHDRFELNRRKLLRRCLGVAGACALGTALNAHDAAAKASKAALLYQEQPNNGRRCGDCKFFSGESDASTGTCALVEGTIDRNGWCTAFSPRT
jgi:hypothetical protein